MGSEAEKDSIHTPKLPLLSPPQAHMQSPERSGMLSPPSQASASVPFRWEDEPGKPKPCTTLTVFSNKPSDFAAKCLELPPRLLYDAKNIPVSESARFQSSSSSSTPFRIGSECYGSFRAGSVSPENMQLGSSMIISKRGTYKEKGLFGSWKRRAFKSRDTECSTKEDTSVKITRIKRVHSFHSLFHSKSKFWVSIYQGLKLAVPWSKRGKKNGYMG